MPENRNNNSVDFCDLLAAYELDLLDTDERVGFENHLTDCSDCLEEMFAMAPAMTELKTHPGGYADETARYLELDKPESWLSRLNRVLFSGPARVLVPVAVAADLAMLIIIPQTTETKFRSLAMTEAPAFSPIQVRAGHQNQWFPLWDSGMQYYRSGEYNSAADDLAQAVNLLAADLQINQSNSSDEQYAVLDNARLYLGVSQMLSDRTVESLNTLQEASESNLMPVRQKSLWFLAQTHLLNEQPQKALTILNQLENSPVYGLQAAALIADIQELIQD